MCVGCLVGTCTVLLTWGSGQLIAWRAMTKRRRAMQQVETESCARPA
jgi:hypothetical protein